MKNCKDCSEIQKNFTPDHAKNAKAVIDLCLQLDRTPKFIDINDKPEKMTIEITWLK